ncbi:MAG: spermine synthase [Chloroflexota bacterium]|nr:spermine synthase [Chloroflexota bacterium]
MAGCETDDPGAPTEASASPTAAGGPPVLAALAARALLAANARGQPATEVSLDLGLSRVEVTLTPEAALLPNGARVAWPDLARIAAATGTVGDRCFIVRADGEIEEIARFSETTNRRCSLVATQGAPTLLVAGVQMHRTVASDPLTDARAKITAIAPVRGAVLDTAMGLGYTAIEAARTASSVMTIELDPAVAEIARLNPWSRALFTNPTISRRIGDSALVVRDLPDRAFQRIIHDPPLFSLAGDLYSGAFYAQLHRLLADQGRLFHYIGNPASPSGARVTRGVVRRLREAGFSRVTAAPSAFGVVAVR